MTATKETVSHYAGLLIGDAELNARALYLRHAASTLRVRSNSTALLDRLARYFSHVSVAATDTDMEVIAIDRATLELDIDFIDWRREPGKAGRKDSYVDLEGGRLLRKVRTGMVFLQSEDKRIAVGPCLRHDNQLINFINSQFMNRLQQDGWLICHAAGLVKGGQVLALAGFSGGGKSTLMLQLLDDTGATYLSNDRLFVRRSHGETMACGIPKLPRVNPGTIVHNPRLHPLLPDLDRNALLRLPAEALWELEDKHDVFIDEIFGTGRIADRGRLAVFLVLNWRRGSGRPTELQRVDLEQRPDLLDAIMKSPGPFYMDADGCPYRDSTPLDHGAYLAALSGVAVYEVSGAVDFSAMPKRLRDSRWWQRHA
jgi:HprK-related kinase B